MQRERCSSCGQLNPHMASDVEITYHKDNDRRFIYEAFGPKSVAHYAHAYCGRCRTDKASKKRRTDTRIAKILRELALA